MSFIVACGTVDGENFTDDHFGESDIFKLYRVDDYGVDLVKKVDNTSREEMTEPGHGDPQKAMDVTRILKSESVNVVMAHQMGPNVVKLSKKFVPVIYRGMSIEDGLEALIDNLYLVEREWRKGENREYLVLEE